MIVVLLLVAFLAGVVTGPLYTAVYVRQQRQRQHWPEPSGAGGEHS